MWVGWPSHAELWEDDLEAAQAEVEGLVRALAGPGREQVRLMVGKAEALAAGSARCADVDGAAVIDGRVGDIGVRDPGRPVGCARCQAGGLAGRRSAE